MKNTLVQLHLENIKIIQQAPDGSGFSGGKKKKVQQKNLLVAISARGYQDQTFSCQ